MTLSARIALRPSRLLSLLETVVPATGFCIAAATLVVRAPGAALPGALLAGVAVIAFAGVARSTWSRRKTHVLVISDHETVGLDGSDDVWRVVEPSFVRPGFAVVALAAADGSASERRIVICVVDAAQDAADRWALHRFLGWLQRGGRRPTAS